GVPADDRDDPGAARLRGAGEGLRRGLQRDPLHGGAGGGRPQRAGPPGAGADAGGHRLRQAADALDRRGQAPLPRRADDAPEGALHGADGVAGGPLPPRERLMASETRFLEETGFLPGTPALTSSASSSPAPPRRARRGRRAATGCRGAGRPRGAASCRRRRSRSRPRSARPAASASARLSPSPGGAAPRTRAPARPPPPGPPPPPPPRT